jgi:RNA polymerase sigma factor (sigma-70 family)
MAGGSWGRVARLLRRWAPEPGEPVPDGELLSRFARDRDEAAFELLVWRHAAMVLGVCRRVLRDEQLAEDAFQAAFLVLARKAGSIHGANLAGWLFRVARRTALRARRQAAARTNREVPLTADPEARTVADTVDRAELAAVLDEEVARLPERLRLPVVLCYLGGHSTEHAARTLGCPQGTVLSRLATARQRLATRLTHRGVTLPAAGLTITGVEVLTAERVFACVAVAIRFVTTRAGLEHHPAARLAEEVMRSAKSKALSALAGGLLVLTAGAGLLFGGLAAGNHRPAPGPETARSEPAPAPAAPVARGPAAPQAPKPDAKPEPKPAKERLQAALRTTEEQIAKLADQIRQDLRSWHREGLATEAEREGLNQRLRKIREARLLAEQVERAIQSAVYSHPDVRPLAERSGTAHTHFINKQRMKDVKPDDPDLQNMKREWERLDKELKALQEKVRAVIEPQFPLPEEVKRLVPSTAAKAQTDPVRTALQHLYGQERDIRDVLANSEWGRIERRQVADDLELLMEIRRRLKRQLFLQELADAGVVLDREPASSELDALKREVEALRAEVKRLKAGKDEE